MSKDKDDLGRYHSPALLILVSLANGNKHGYAMMEDIESISGVKLGPGTLYGAISRLESRGLIAPLDADTRRRPYALTGKGQRFLQTELDRLQSWSTEGLQRLANT
jgi:DNA-binding PadR family transcriptional regulator